MTLRASMNGSAPPRERVSLLPAATGMAAAPSARPPLRNGEVSSSSSPLPPPLPPRRQRQPPPPLLLLWPSPPSPRCAHGAGARAAPPEEEAVRDAEAAARAAPRAGARRARARGTPPGAPRDTVSVVAAACDMAQPRVVAAAAKHSVRGVGRGRARTVSTPKETGGRSECAMRQRSSAAPAQHHEAPQLTSRGAGSGALCVVTRRPRETDPGVRSMQSEQRARSKSVFDDTSRKRCTACRRAHALQARRQAAR
jgi:hypothetical protein